MSKMCAASLSLSRGSKSGMPNELLSTERGGNFAATCAISDLLFHKSAPKFHRRPRPFSSRVMLDRHQQGAFRSPSDFWGRIRLARRVLVGCELGSSGTPHRNSAQFGSRQVHRQFAKTRTLQPTSALAGTTLYRAALHPPTV